jgi:thiol-disulfide isomerase/thioredoxin
LKEPIDIVNMHKNQHISENELNPSPRSYRVSFKMKCYFVVIAMVGLAAYFYMVVERRYAQSVFVQNNQMAAVYLDRVKAPDFVVDDVKTDEQQNLSSYCQGWTLINIWATWCTTCQQEMPSLELLQQKMKGLLSIVALSVDDDMASVKNFVDTTKPTFHMVFDKQKASNLAFQVNKYPETFLLSPDGNLLLQFSGPRDWSSSKSIEFLLNIIK